MIINLVAGGPSFFLPPISSFNPDEQIWVGVDRGTIQLLKRGIIPHMAIGDFDSMSEEEFQSISNKIKNIKRYPPEKDATDLEIALQWAIDEKPKKIQVFGATGGRLDHFLGNLQLFMKALQSDVEMVMIDNQNWITVKKQGQYHFENASEYPYISFIPVQSDISKLTLLGFKYPLHKRDIPYGSTLCISNEIIDHFGTISFESGILMVVRSTD